MVDASQAEDLVDLGGNLFAGLHDGRSSVAAARRCGHARIVDCRLSVAVGISHVDNEQRLARLGLQDWFARPEGIVGLLRHADQLVHRSIQYLELLEIFLIVQKKASVHDRNLVLDPLERVHESDQRPDDRQQVSRVATDKHYLLVL